MFLEKDITADKKNRMIIGYDLGDQTSQISFCRLDQGEPETASVVAGEEQYNFPTVLCKRLEANQWVYGKEARRLADEGRGVPVERLLTLAREGEVVEVDGESFDPVALLALFIRRSLSLLNLQAATEPIEALMITVDTLDQATVRALREAVSVMQLQTEHIYFQSHAESFYQYTIHQPRELWMGQVLLCDYEEGQLQTCRLEYNRRTTPVVFFTEEKTWPQLLSEDQALLQVLEERCEGRNVSAAYLIGKGFEGDWYQESLRYLCRGRRVFGGNNLYSKGACYGAREKLAPGELAKQYVFLGRDILKSNLGMRVLRRGQESYFALLDAGESWTTARGRCEFYLESGNSFTIRVTSLTGNESRDIEIVLHDLPARNDRATRIGLTVTMESEHEAVVTAEDLGFGEIYPATHKVWQEEFSV